ncbi:radical SAM protein [Ruminiclostridium papyrosolvens]|uniref:7-carboxy-7-deazaguanine synthase n=1 Tax=Ruminiclostridium papyrosolvens C7 TaxID=1330534 RepID=U4R382_9FIRM|nr:radical SAM protein [Ruminiclostridium papyrosolvens]EPR12783.1 radical SAM protein [Ruminiclostridium papyrosolvens C7]
MNLQQFEQSRMPIIEIFNSVSGEGVSAGSVMTFVRVAGCNLRCDYCDTKYSYNEFSNDIQELKPNEIVNILDNYNCKNVLCTGGEPLELNKVKRYLPLYLALKGFKVRIETNGSYPLYSKTELNDFVEDTNFLKLNYALDVKCPDSGMSNYNIYNENFKLLGSDDEIKFIVGSRRDLEFAFETIKEHRNILSQTGVTINFSPVFGKLDCIEIVNMLKEKNAYFEEYELTVRLSLQIHKFIWPLEARGV